MREDTPPQPTTTKPPPPSRSASQQSRRNDDGRNSGSGAGIGRPASDPSPSFAFPEVSDSLEADAQCSAMTDTSPASPSGFLERAEHKRRTAPPPSAPPSILKRQLEASQAQLARMRGEPAALRLMPPAELMQLIEETRLALSRMDAVLCSKQADALICAICYDAPKDTVLVPCGHQTCAACAVRLATCAVCRQDVAQTVRTFST